MEMLLKLVMGLVWGYAPHHVQMVAKALVKDAKAAVRMVARLHVVVGVDKVVKVHACNCVLMIAYQVAKPIVEICVVERV
jgi:uncharacterized protein YjeT (DUF2065 family)